MLKKISLILCQALLLFACAKQASFILLNNTKNQENSDHKSCLSLKIKFDERVNFANNEYWRCRLSFAKYRLVNNPTTKQQQKQNKNIADLIEKINDKINDHQLSQLEKEIERVDEQHHQQCLSMGYEFESEDKQKVDLYFSCRNSLIENYMTEAPFGNESYLPYQHRNYDLAYAINKRTAIDNEIRQKLKTNYPKCSDYPLHSNELKKCIDNQKKISSCLQEAMRKNIIKEQGYKIICQQQAYVRFGDNLLKPEEGKIDYIKQKNYNADLAYKLNFESIGMSELDFISKQEQKELEKQQEKANELVFNSKDHLYNRYELAQIRKKYIIFCNEFVDTKMLQYRQKLNNECTKIDNE